MAKSKSAIATEIGILISNRPGFSKETLAFIEEWDPDLHYAIMQFNKKPRKRRRKK